MARLNFFLQEEKYIKTSATGVYGSIYITMHLNFLKKLHFLSKQQQLQLQLLKCKTYWAASEEFLIFVLNLQLFC